MNEVLLQFFMLLFQFPFQVCKNTQVNLNFLDIFRLMPNASELLAQKHQVIFILFALRSIPLNTDMAKQFDFDFLDILVTL